MEKRLRHSIVRNSFWNLIYVTISKLGGILFTIFLARILLPNYFGIYSIILSIMMLFFIFTDLGVNTATLRYLSNSLKKNKKSFPAYYHYLIKIKVYLSLSVSIIFILLSYILSLYLLKDTSFTLPFILSAIYLFVFTIDLFYLNLFYVAEKVKLVSLREIIYQVLRLVSIVLLAFIAEATNKISVLFIYLIFLSLCLIVYSRHYLKKYLPDLSKKPEAVIDKNEVLGFIGFLTIAAISGTIFSYMDSIMLAIFVEPEFVGYYKVAFTLILGIVGLMAFPNSILLNAFSKLDKKKVQTILNTSFRYISIISLPAIFGLVALGRFFIKALYGSSYLPASLPLYVLSFSIFPMILMGLILQLFSAENKPKLLARLIIPTTLLNLVLNYVFISFLVKISPIYAVMGVSLATSLSWLFYLILAIKKINCNLGYSLPFSKLLKPLFSSLIMWLIIYLLIKWMGNINLFLGILLVVIGVVSYSVILYLLGGLSKRDIYLIKLARNNTLNTKIFNQLN